MGNRNGENVLCPHCGAMIPTSSVYCPQCGQKQKREDVLATPTGGAPANNWFSQAGGLDDPPTPPVTPASHANETPAHDGRRSSESVCKPPVSATKTRSHTPEKWERRTSITPVKPDMSADSFNRLAMYKKPIVIGAAICIVVVIVVLLLSRGGPKNEKEIIADLPESLTSVYLDGELVTMTVEKLEIEKRQTKDDVDNVFCKIQLTTDTFTVTSYQKLSYVKYNGNEWILDWYTPYATEEMQVLSAPENLYDWAVSNIKSQDSGYADVESYITGYDTTLSESGVTYVFDISKSVGIMSKTGQIAVYCTLVGSVAEGKFWWSGFSDYSGVQMVWDVEGLWYGELQSLKNYTLFLNISSLTSEGISCDWDYFLDNESYAGDGEDCSIFESNDELIRVRFDYGPDTELVTFYTDGTCVVKFMWGDCYLERT